MLLLRSPRGTYARPYLTKTTRQRLAQLGIISSLRTQATLLAMDMPNISFPNTNTILQVLGAQHRFFSMGELGERPVRALTVLGV
jgi:hypothetical protein